MKDRAWSIVLACVLGTVLVGCGSDDHDSRKSEDTPDSDAKGDAQTPPTSSGTDVEAWLAKGDYKDWSCETVEHPQLKVSPHGHNRVCSNDLAAAFSGGAGKERPIKSAAVKELYDDASTLVGYAVEVKVAAKSSGGNNWYWYERVPADKGGVVADGFGDSGTAKSICVGCHVAAGVDDPHSVTGSADFMYLQVEP